MDFIDVPDNNSNNHEFCPSCDGKMLYVTKGRLAEKYVCESCGTTINPEVDYLNHDNELSSMYEDENDLDSISIVQKQDPPKNESPDSWVDRDIKMEIERGGRKQVVSITNLAGGPVPFAANDSHLSKINRIERPKRP